jgi:ribokinase
VAVVMVPPDGKKGIVFAPNANMEWTHEDAAEVAQQIFAARTGAVLVMDCGVASHVLERAAAAAVDSEHRFILDPSPAERATDKLIAAASIMVPNALEAEQLTGIKCDDAKRATKAGTLLLERGTAAACIKLPEGGCVLVEKQQVTHVGAVPVDVVDTTGAGDAFAAALAAALVQRYSLVEAVTLAVAASHLAVMSYGAQTAPLTWNRLQEMAKRLEVRTKARSAH